MVRVFFIRHGETDYNLNHIVQGGGVDSSLNHTGRTQAARFFQHYHHIPFDGVISSNLKRTQQTLKPFGDLKGYDIQPYPEFDELNWGNLEGLPGTPEIREEYVRMNAEWDKGNLDARIEGGESPLEGWKRSREGIQKLLKEFPSGSNVLVCAHGRILRIMLSEVLGYGMRYMNWFPHQNTALNVLQIRKDEKAIALKLNDTTHLSE